MSTSAKSTSSPEEQPRFLSMRQVEEKVELSQRTIYCLKSRGDFPVSVHLSPGVLRFISEEIDEWLDSRCRRHGHGNNGGE